MDAGLAGVLGALAGSVSATVAAFIGGLYTREVAHLGARSEHLNNRWEMREERYNDFLTLLKTAEDQLDTIVRLLLATQSVSVELEIFLDIVNPVEGSLRNVVLVGPASIGEAAQIAADLSITCRRSLEGFRHARAPLRAGNYFMDADQVRWLGEMLAAKCGELERARIAFEMEAVRDLRDYGGRR